MCRSTVVQQSANCHLPPFTKIFCQQSADCRPIVGSMSVICWPSVGWIPEKLQLAEKNIAYRREMKLSLFESAILFSFFRDQSPRNLLCLGFLGTKPLTIPSHHPRSQEAKNLFTAASCSVFFCFTKSEHYQLIFIIGHWLLKTWWLLKELFLLRVKLHS